MLVKMRTSQFRPPALISLGSIDALSGIASGDGTRIGAMTTIGELTGNAMLIRDYPVLVEAARRLGSMQIRNAATIGGNLANCSPCADTAPPLLVHEARVRLQSPGGEREIPIDQFFLGPGESCLGPSEIITAVVLDPPAPGTRAASMKKGRVKMDLAVASVAVLLELDGSRCTKARIAAGSVAPVPLRLLDVERLFEGETLSGDLVAAAQGVAMSSVSPITDIRSTEEYRRQIVGVYLKRIVERLMKP
jgi:CO/xanthine dehydrogenase FAD-binding subunit